MGISNIVVSSAQVHALQRALKDIPMDRHSTEPQQTDLVGLEPHRASEAPFRDTGFCDTPNGGRSLAVLRG